MMNEFASDTDCEDSWSEDDDETDNGDEGVLIQPSTSLLYVVMTYYRKLRFAFYLIVIVTYMLS